METVLRYLLDESLVRSVFLHLAWIGPLGGLALGALAARLSGSGSRTVLRGLLLGLLGPLNWLLWTTYDAITDALGLDRVLNLLVNLALFVILGLLLGLAWRRLDRQAR